MFNKKIEQDMQQFKEDVKSKISSMSSSLHQRIKEQEMSFSEIRSRIGSIQEKNLENAEKLKQEMQEICSIKSEFETSLNRINSISRSIEKTAASEVRKVADEEIERMRAGSAKLRDAEDDLNDMLEGINSINMEISKFLDISKQIRLVDFTLKSHQQDIQNYEKEKIRLLDENEKLKSIMAKMKRNRR